MLQICFIRFIKCIPLFIVNPPLLKTVPHKVEITHKMSREPKLKESRNTPSSGLNLKPENQFSPEYFWRGVYTAVSHHVLFCFQSSSEGSEGRMMVGLLGAAGGLLLQEYIREEMQGERRRHARNFFCQFSHVQVVSKAAKCQQVNTKNLHWFFELTT